MEENPTSRVSVVRIWQYVELRRGEMNTTDPTAELHRFDPRILAISHVTEVMRRTFDDVRDKINRGEMPVMWWGQQLRIHQGQVHPCNATGPLWSNARRQSARGRRESERGMTVMAVLLLVSGVAFI